MGCIILQFGVLWLNKMLLPVGTVCVSVPVGVCVCVCTIVFDNVLGMVVLRVRLLKANCCICAGSWYLTYVLLLPHKKLKFFHLLVCMSVLPIALVLV